MKKKLFYLMAVIFLISGFAHIKAAIADNISSSQSLWDTTSISDSSVIKAQVENLKLLKTDLESEKPTVAFFYYSVACSCAAAKCNIASVAIDSIPELKKQNLSLNFLKIDAYLVPEAESLYNIMFVPAIIYFDKNGKEVNRLEWGTSREAIKMLIEHPETKQAPLD